MSNDIFFHPKKKKTEAVKNTMNYVILQSLDIYMYIFSEHAVFSIYPVLIILCYLSQTELMSLAFFDSCVWVGGHNADKHGHAPERGRGQGQWVYCKQTLIRPLENFACQQISCTCLKL